MCVDHKVFLNLCDLYPKTAANLKYRALERREHMMRSYDVQSRLTHAMSNHKATAILRHKLLTKLETEGDAGNVLQK